jgi:hypothetical protein
VSSLQPHLENTIVSMNGVVFGQPATRNFKPRIVDDPSLTIANTDPNANKNARPKARIDACGGLSSTSPERPLPEL